MIDIDLFYEGFDLRHQVRFVIAMLILENNFLFSKIKEKKKDDMKVQEIMMGNICTQVIHLTACIYRPSSFVWTFCVLNRNGLICRFSEQKSKNSCQKITKSPIWDYFSFKHDKRCKRQDANKVVCCLRRFSKGLKRDKSTW